jgi:hypothetical protein
MPSLRLRVSALKKTLIARKKTRIEREPPLPIRESKYQIDHYNIARFANRQYVLRDSSA